MSKSADDVIGEIFAEAGNDEATARVAEQLRDLWKANTWNADAIGRVLDREISSA